MWKFLVGFASGVYVGTYYNCKPMIHELEKKINDFIPDKKSKQ